MAQSEQLETANQVTAGRPRRRRLITGIVAVTLVAGALAAVHGGATSSAGATGSAGVAASLASDNAVAATNAQAMGGGRFGGGMAMAGRFAGGLTVSSISGDTIKATARAGQTVTITVTSSTKYTRAGAGITLSQIAKGDRIAVQGTRSSPTAITATAIQVILPTEFGVVTKVSGSTITLSSFNSTSRTVTVSGSTTYTRAGQAASLSDISTGTAIEAEGTTAADGSLSALRVVIETPRLLGQVTAVSGSTITISSASRSGTSTETVTTTESTTYFDTAGTAVKPSTIAKGTYIVAEGTLSADGKSMTALRITVMPTGRGGFAGHGSRGGGATGGGYGVPGQPGHGSTSGESPTGSGI